MERALQNRLARRFSPALIEGAVNDKGQRIRDVVAEQSRMNRNQKKKLTSSFWAHLITSFKLSADAICDSLPGPQPGESIPEELLEKLGMVHADNSASRTTEPLERSMDHVAELRYIELYGIVKASMEGPKVTRSASTRLLLSALKYIARPFWSGPRHALATALFGHFQCAMHLYMFG